MNSNSSGGRLERFFAGKGFYIVLFLCAAVIGVSAWMMAAGEKTMEDVNGKNGISLDNPRVETVIIPPQKQTEEAMDLSDEALPAEAPVMSEQGLAETALPESDQGVEVWREGDIMEVAAPMYIWPVMGDIERRHSLEALAYDLTLSDWRTHEGIDILVPVGSTVSAAHCGTVESVYEDDLYGVTVVVDHGDGAKTVYSNLAAETLVAVGDWVEPGTQIGSVGSTALCEISQQEHLHFSITVDGRAVDPLSYLPA